MLGRLLRGLAEDAEVRRQVRLLGVVTAWLLLLSSLLRIVDGHVIRNGKPEPDVNEIKMKRVKG